jgi:uncharacterized SAM-binding protein YcdF (DUF218 family)
MPQIYQKERRETCDAVVVLGAAMQAPGVPGPALLRRIEHGIKTFGELDATHLVVSGGIVGPPPAEAHVMRDIAVSRGVPPEAIIVEDRSRNTFENAVYTGRFIRSGGWRHVVVVTDGFHMVRALHTFRRLGLPASAAPAPKPAHHSALRWSMRYLEDLGRCACSEWLFMLGKHKRIVEREWGV